MGFARACLRDDWSAFARTFAASCKAFSTVLVAYCVFRNVVVKETALFSHFT
jgi:hypothetical protein